jgi:BlaI family transcriptional regulator, penicillinase repressor
MSRRAKQALSPLENAAMRILWKQRTATADDVRSALGGKTPLKNSTVRTILRRLESKGYVSHVAEGRTYVYSPQIESQNVAAAAVRSIIDRFCGGSIENLLLGMVDDQVVSPEKLQELAERISRKEAEDKPVRNVKKR